MTRQLAAPSTGAGGITGASQLFDFEAAKFQRALAEVGNDAHFDVFVHFLLIAAEIYGTSEERVAQEDCGEAVGRRG